MAFGLEMQAILLCFFIANGTEEVNIFYLKCDSENIFA